MVKSVGIYSFPKSGNTWMRNAIASAMNIRPRDYAVYMPRLYADRVMTEPHEFGGNKYYFYKSHDARVVREYNGQRIRTNTIIYVKRHPLDVFVSYANFISDNVTGTYKNFMDIELPSVDSIKGTPILDALFKCFLVYGTLTPHSRKFGSWFEQMEYFHSGPKGPTHIHVVRYEDMLDNFDEVFPGVMQAIGVDEIDVEAVKAEVERRTARDGKFFWKRSKRTHEEYLTPEQIELFRSVHGEKMARFGYD